MDPGFQNRIGSRFYSVRFSDKADSIAPAGPPDPEGFGWVTPANGSILFKMPMFCDGGKYGEKPCFSQDEGDAADLATCHCGMKVFIIQDFILMQGKAAGKFRS